MNKLKKPAVSLLALFSAACLFAGCAFGNVTGGKNTVEDSAIKKIDASSIDTDANPFTMKTPCTNCRTPFPTTSRSR